MIGSAFSALDSHTATAQQLARFQALPRILSPDLLLHLQCGGYWVVPARMHSLQDMVYSNIHEIRRMPAHRTTFTCD